MYIIMYIFLIIGDSPANSKECVTSKSSAETFSIFAKC